MITTKNQQKKLLTRDHGYGWLIFRSGEDTITEVEIYVGMDSKVRRVSNSELLFPIDFIDENGNKIIVKA